MKNITASLLFLFAAASYAADSPRLSEETEACLTCHESVSPGIVADWRDSRHATTTPAEALKKPALARRISAATVPETHASVAVGCYECHSLRPDKHADNFEHFGYRINIVVSPDDCATCHPTERDEYARSKKAHAIGNLRNNPVYHTLVKTVLGVEDYADGKLSAHLPSAAAEMDACFGCHGTEVKVVGMRKVDSPLGEIEIPQLSGWPNQGVGRINPDGSMGACTACHPRHGFSMEVARKPYTCGQCHLDPDTPAFNVYKESKHGNIFDSVGEKWNWDEVPWRIGKDFKTPTCATCHNALVTSPDGEVIAPRTHDFGARLWVRLFGPIYAHPQPKHGDTSVIRNRDGQPLPTTFDNVPASDYLITPAEQSARRAAMEKLCQGCHSSQWAKGHFDKMHQTIDDTNAMTLSATRIMQEAWEKGYADAANPFDEPIERMWIEQWLFYSNSVRYASAMSGPDYAAFKNGWWELTKNLRTMKEWLDEKKKSELKKGGKKGMLF